VASIWSRALAVTRTRLDLARKRGALEPPVGGVDFGDLRRTSPISASFGLDRGTPVDRYYVERFLAENSSAIRGTVLEVADRTYTTRFGGNAVTRSEVLHLTGDSPEATIVGDLTVGLPVAENTFDCVILTQTLQFIYDTPAALAEVHRILAPGGTVLCTVSGISQISRFDAERWGDYWRFTSMSLSRLFAGAFGDEVAEVTAHGNVLAATAALQGLASGELTRAELDVRDDDYQLVLTVRATKAGA